MTIYKDTYRFIGMNRDTEDTFLSKGDYRLLKNARLVSADGKKYSVSNLKGSTLQVNNNLPTGFSQQVIGQVQDRKRNGVIFFLYNDSGNHTIFIRTKTEIKVLITWLYLNFDPAFPVHHACIIDDLLFWSDQHNNDRMLNIETALSGGYETPYEVNQFDFIKRPPVAIPALQRVDDSQVPYNKISFRNLQFAYRYQYINNEFSVFSPVSLMSYANETKTEELVKNKISITINAAPKGVKTIEVAFIEDNNGIYNVFAKGGADQTVFYYTGSEIYETIEESESSKYFEPASLVSSVMTSMENRIIKNRKKVGYDVDESQFSITLSKLVDVSARKDLMKSNGYYEVGVIFIDDYGRTSGVKGIKSINIGNKAMLSDVSVTINDNTLIRAAITGTPPLGFSRYRFVISKEQNFEIYQQVVGQFFFFIVDDPEETISLTADQIRVDQKVYKKSLPANSDEYSFIYIKLPLNIMFVPDTECYVRIMNDSSAKEEKILAIVGDFLIVKNFGIEDWSANTAVKLLEIYKPAETRDRIFYETGDVYEIIGTSFNVTSDIDIQADNKIVDFYLINNRSFVYDMSGFFSSGVNNLDYTIQQEAQGRVESLSHYFNDISDYENVTAETQTEKKTKVKWWAFAGPGTALLAETVGGGIVNTNIKTIIEKINVKNLFANDYSKAATSYGRGFVKVEDRQLSQGNVLEFSDRYLQDSNTNGVSVFSVANQYPLPNERGDVVKLVMAGNVLLAIHQQFITSLYIGEGFIRQGNDAILAKTEGYIGDDRLSGEYGTQHPESVVEHNGIVYGFDCRQGVVWRYSGQGGVFPISLYGMEGYFREKGHLYYPLIGSKRIIGGYDPQNHEYVLTFEDSSNARAETVVFSEKDNRWIYFADYHFNLDIPSLYSKDDKLLAFKDGNVHIMNDNDVCNNFFGEQYGREIQFLFNMDPSRPKVFNNIWIHSESIGAEDDKIIELTNSEGQKSYILTSMFKDVEGIFRAPVMMDINNSPNIDEDRRIFDGKRMRSKIMHVTIRDNSTSFNIMSLVEAYYKYSEFVK